MSKEFELKLCPFCGGGASIEIAWVPDPSGGEMECRLIICHGCNAQMQDEVENLAELVRKWNTRHDFTAGRALGRREMKGEAKLVAISAARAAESIGQLADENTTGRDRMFARSREAAAIAEAIEAIKE